MTIDEHFVTVGALPARRHLTTSVATAITRVIAPVTSAAFDDA